MCGTVQCQFVKLHGQRLRKYNKEPQTSGVLPCLQMPSYAFPSSSLPPSFRSAATILDAMGWCCSRFSWNVDVAASRAAALLLECSARYSGRRNLQQARAAGWDAEAETNGRLGWQP